MTLHDMTGEYFDPHEILFHEMDVGRADMTTFACRYKQKCENGT